MSDALAKNEVRPTMSDAKEEDVKHPTKSDAKVNNRKRGGNVCAVIFIQLWRPFPERLVLHGVRNNDGKVEVAKDGAAELLRQRWAKVFERKRGERFADEWVKQFDCADVVPPGKQECARFLPNGSYVCSRPRWPTLRCVEARWSARS